MAQIQKKQSVLIILIHNNDIERNNKIRPNLAKLKEALSNEFIVKTAEISSQLKLVPHSMLMLLRRDLTNLSLAYQWSRYRLIKITAIIRYLKQIISLLATLYKYLLNVHNIFTRRQKSSAIEICVTDKHIRGWDIFLESNCETLLMFEDDAIFKSNTFSKLLYALSEAHKLASDTLLYADLAGGCALEELEISHLKKAKKYGVTIYSKPVTNTACAYLLNRSIVEEFKDLIINYPNYRLIAVDWMINKLLIEIERRNKKTLCFHFEPTALNHGSATGDYPPWKRKA